MRSTPIPSKEENCNSSTLIRLDQSSHCYPDFRVLRIMLGVLLLFAAIMKTHAIWFASARSYSTFHIPPWLVQQSVIVEWVLGAWLLSGRHVVFAWKCALACFAIFFSIALYMYSSGAEVCGCFGIFAVPPLVTVIVDFTALVALLLSPPSHNRMPIGVNKLKRFRGYLANTLAFSSISLITAFGTIEHSDIYQYQKNGSGLPPVSKGSPDNRQDSLVTFLVTGGIRISDSRAIATLEVPKLVRSIIGPQSKSEVSIKTTDIEELLSLEPDKSNLPSTLIETVDGRYYVVLGIVSEFGEKYFQLVEGKGLPFLLVASNLNSSSVKTIWQLTASPRISHIIKFGDAAISVSRLHANVGMMMPYSKKETEFTFSNVGKSSVLLDGPPKTSCNCTTVGIPENKVILPGESVSLTTAITTDTRNVRSLANVIFKDKATSLTGAVALELFATQQKSMLVSPPKLNFGVVTDQVKVKRTVRLSEVATDRFEVTGVKATDAAMQYKINGIKDENGLFSHYVEIELEAKDLLPGEYKKLIKIDTSSKRRPTITVPVSYSVPSRIRMKPNSFNFPKLRVSQSHSITAEIIVPEPEADEYDISLGSLPEDLIADLSQSGPCTYELTVGLTPKSGGAFYRSFDVFVKHKGRDLSFQASCTAYVEK